MVLQREGADELQNRRAIAAFIRCWGAGKQKRSLSPPLEEAHANVRKRRSPGSVASIFSTDCVTYAPVVTCGDENFGKRSGFLIT